MNLIERFWLREIISGREILVGEFFGRGTWPREFSGREILAQEFFSGSRQILPQRNFSVTDFGSEKIFGDRF